VQLRLPDLNMSCLLAAEITLSLSLLTSYVVGSRGALKTWTVFQSYQNAPANPTGRRIPSHADYSPASWAAPRMRIAATTHVALATIVFAKLALALAPSYNGPWSLAFIAQVGLFVGGTSTAFQAVAFSDAESLVSC